MVNLSNRTLSDNEQLVLAKGLNYAPTPTEIPIRKIVAAVEDGLRKVGRSEADLARTYIVDILNQSKPPINNMSREIKATKDLSRDTSIVILPADKGKSTVVLNSSEYDGKIKTIILDRKTYKKLKHDPASALERRMNDLLLS